MKDYTPTPQDRENGQRVEEWKARQREDARRAIVRQLEQKQNERVRDCLERWYRFLTD